MEIPSTVPGGIIEFLEMLFNSESPAANATVWLDEAPMRSRMADGTEFKVLPPYLEVIDNSTKVGTKFDTKINEASDFTVRIHATTLNQCGKIALWMRFGGCPKEERAGLDQSHRIAVEGLIRTIPILNNFRFSKEAGRGDSASIMYAGEFNYSIVAAGRETLGQAPLIISASALGSTVTVVWNTAVTDLTAMAMGSITLNGVAMTYVSGNGSKTITYSLASPSSYGTTYTMAGTAFAVESNAATYNQAFAGQAVTNLNPA